MSGRWFRFPSVQGDRLVFTCEDDLWIGATSGGVARRLTTGLGGSQHPQLNDDGSRVAFVGTEEGVRDVYVIDADGGRLRRLTWGTDAARVVGWNPAGDVVFTSAMGRAFPRETHLYTVSAQGGLPRILPYGPAASMAFGAQDRLALGLHHTDLAWWKGYRGGRAGVIWVRSSASAPFVRLALPGAACLPSWLRSGRLAFVSDGDGDPQLYSCAADGSDVQRHTDHPDLAVRFAAGDGEQIVYTHEGDLWRWAPDAAPARVEIDLRSQQPRLQRRFPAAAPYLEGVDMHPDGHSLVAIVRGKPLMFGHWDGPVRQLGVRDGVRYGRARFIDGERILVTTDEGGIDALQVLHTNGDVDPPWTDHGIGRAMAVEVDPTGRRAAVADHRQDLYLLDLADGTARLVQSGTHYLPFQLTWSADGRWLAWCRAEAPWAQRTSLQLLRADDPEATPVQLTEGAYQDLSPSFDPAGDHLYFISSRDFDPVHDSQYFGYSFVRGARPYVITLRDDVPHPLRPAPKPLRAPKRANGGAEDPPEVEIDLDGVRDRIVAFPVAEGRFEKVIGVGEGQVLLVRGPIRGTLDETWGHSGPPHSDLQLLSFDFDKRELTLLNSRVSDVLVDRARDHAVIQSGWRLRVVPARPDRGQRDEIKRNDGRTGRKHYWVDLGRLRPSLDPRLEWRQMVDEAWRLMRDHFWQPSMGGVDWDAVRSRYATLVDRVSTRSELSDLIWTMQGELRTSHAYEMGGDHPDVPAYRIGRLGADLAWDAGAAGWRVTRIPQGDPGIQQRASPLRAPGAGIREGDVITAISGIPASEHVAPEQALVHQGGALVELAVRSGGADEPRIAVVCTLEDERPLRYRAWILANRQQVHQASEGRIGYIHIPDMGPGGFAEFHRDYMKEAARDALLVDVRWNRGGHVSQLLLYKIARRRLGYSVPRWGLPNPYPADSVSGPMACLTNEMAGSDGDIFSHAWKLLELGPLIGTRTWGGVVGISPRTRLVDRAVITQPEYSTWFKDVGYGLENRGTEPTEEVVFGPDAWAAGDDPQLARGIEALLERLSDTPQAPPDLRRPDDRT